MLERWAQVKEGLGQVVLLSGEGGIGKSRLVQVLKDHVASEPHTRLECRCSPYHTKQRPVSGDRPVAAGAAVRSRTTPLTTNCTSLSRRLPSLVCPWPRRVPLFAALLSLPLPERRYPPLTLTPQRQKQKTLEAFLALLVERAAQAARAVYCGRPALGGSLHAGVARPAGGPGAHGADIASCCTFRPQFTPPWAPRAHIAQLTLNRLPRQQVVRMVTHVAGGKALPAEVVQQIVAKTDGVPLFVEEMTKLVLASGLLREHEDHYALTGPLPPLAIPATLQDSLMARLDQLASAKAVAQLGATLGREFAYELLRAVSPLDEATLQRGCVSWWRPNCSTSAACCRRPPTCSSTPSSRRRRISRCSEHPAAVPPAHCAGVGGAVSRDRRDAARTAGPSLHRGGPPWRGPPLLAAGGATRHRALGVCRSDQPPHQGAGGAQDAARYPERAQHELDVLIALGVPLMATKGYGGP